MSWDTQDTQTAFLLYGPENKEARRNFRFDWGPPPSFLRREKERKKFVPSIFNYFHSICQQKASQLFCLALDFHARLLRFTYPHMNLNIGDFKIHISHKNSHFP